MPVIELYTEQSETSPSTTITLNKPSGVQIGELLLLIIINDETDGHSFSDNLTGWEFIGEFGNTTSDSIIALYWRIADGTEPSQIQVSQDESHEWVAWYVRISGVDTENPINQVGTPSMRYGNYVTAQYITTTIDYCLALCFGGFDGGDGFPFSIDGTDWSKVDDLQSGSSGTSDASGVWGKKDMGSAGSTLSVVIYSNGISDGMIGVQIAIAPGGEAETPVLVQDTLNLNEGISKERRFSISDSMGASDELPLTDRTFSLTDVLDLLDSILKQRSLSPISDIVSLVDLISKERTISSILDALNLSDITIRDKILLIQDTVSLSDELILLKNLGIIDTFNLGDNIIVTHGPIAIQIIDALTLLDAVLKERQLNVQDTESLIDIILKERRLNIQDAGSLVDGVLKERQLDTQDTYKLVDVTFKERNLLPIEDATNITDLITLLKTFGITDTLNLIDSILIDFGVTEVQVLDIISLTDTPLTDKPTLIITDTVALLDDILGDKYLTIEDQTNLIDYIKTYSGMGWHGKIYGISNFKDVLNILKERIEKINKVD